MCHEFHMLDYINSETEVDVDVTSVEDAKSLPYDERKVSANNIV